MTQTIDNLTAHIAEEEGLSLAAVKMLAEETKWKNPNADDGFAILGRQVGFAGQLREKVEVDRRLDIHLKKEYPLPTNAHVLETYASAYTHPFDSFDPKNNGLKTIRGGSEVANGAEQYLLDAGILTKDRHEREDARPLRERIIDRETVGEICGRGIEQRRSGGMRATALITSIADYARIHNHQFGPTNGEALSLYRAALKEQDKGFPRGWQDDLFKTGYAGRFGSAMVPLLGAYLQEKGLIKTPEPIRATSS